MQRWYALYTKPRREFIVADSLEVRGIAVFVPCIEYHGKRGNLLDKPFFPRYVFARFDWEKEGWAGVQWTRGLTRVVSFDGQPAYLRDDQIRRLARTLQGIDGDDFLRIKPGTHVRVVSGPFKDMDAVFQQHLNCRERVAVLLEVLGRQTRVELQHDAIKVA